jgi:hypothetical protein
MSKKLSPVEAATHVLLTYVQADQTLPGEVAEMLVVHTSSSRAAIITQYQNPSRQTRQGSSSAGHTSANGYVSIAVSCDETAGL